MISKDSTRVLITFNKDDLEFFNEYCKKNYTTKSLFIGKLIDDLRKQENKRGE